MPERTSLPKAIGWSIAFIVLTLVLALLLGFGIAVLLTGSPDAAGKWLESNGPGAVVLQAVVTLVSTAVFTWLLGMRGLGLTTTDLRYQGERQGSGFVLGGVAGALTASAALAVAVTFGGAEWTREQGTVMDYFQAAFTTVLVLAPAALSEELIFRGVPLVLLAKALGRGSAVVVVSIAFALAHLANPGVTVLGIGNIALAGIFLGLAFYAPGGIWTAFGAHLGWNAMLAALDTPVSGVPFQIPFIDYDPGAPGWLTGGHFGPEGGLSSTLALTLAVLIARRWAGRNTT